MNKWLADSFSRVNALFAVLIILVAIMSGAGMAADNRLLGAVGGLIVGVIAAVLICGLLATILDMRRILADIAKKLEDLPPRV